MFDFGATEEADKHLLGGKGAGLAEMTNLGLPVPPGFTITTEACRRMMAEDSLPDELWDEVDEAVSRLEERTGRSFGGGPVPLLVSVRSGAVASMPGMMDTVLNLGSNEGQVAVLADWSGDRHFAWDVYRRFIQMYADVVLGVPDRHFQSVLSELRGKRGVESDADLTADDLEEAANRFIAIVREHSHRPVPTDPREQLKGAIEAVFHSWDNQRAIDYRRIHGIPHELGTACNVQMMAFGDLGPSSGTGVCFTRDPGTGLSEPYGDYLPHAQGEDVVAGIRNTLSLEELADLHPGPHAELIDVMKRLEQHYRDMLDIEFTIEKGELFILQTRVGKRTAQAAVRLAVKMVEDGLIDRDDAIMRVDPNTIEQLHRPRIDETADGESVANGIAASPGAASGRAAFDAVRAVEMASEGDVILVRPETTPDDINGMAAARGILTAQGGKTSHAAVVARGMGKPAVTGASGLVIDMSTRTALCGDHDIREGDTITIDGTTGAVYVGEVPLVEPKETPELATLLGWADEVRTLGIRANADTPEDAALARSLGAEGIGLARTEHMFMGERLEIVQRVILSENPAERKQALERLERQQVDDFEGLLEAMDGLPVIVRLLDPPLHEFLPDRRELEREILRRVWANRSVADLQRMSSEVARWEEDNPMLGLRGVRLGLMFPELYRLQAGAAAQALVRRIRAGGDPHLEVMIPLVATTTELERMREMVEEEIAAVGSHSGIELHVPIGTMIELPRAALTAGEIARVADFFSFGTNDLTQMTYGLSRDDAEGLFLGDYLEKGILSFNPFQTLDTEGVGRLVRVGTHEGRQGNPDLVVGVCGEHGGDPASIAFCMEIGLDYVSASTPRVEGARLAAAQAALKRESETFGA
ncbi:MAG TPA: pyruvate, phosphate dikinase [Acidimicrobiia bacterium]|nr:pyruvate, phosphate dikinase [Acidimicrobiia bacterium]